MIRPPPRSTLFPYPTLSRSEILGQQPPHRRIRLVQLECQAADRTAIFASGLDDQRPIFGETGDRKSTRLNSSHANISYAVFCLKKKKTIKYRMYCISHN